MKRILTEILMAGVYLLMLIPLAVIVIIGQITDFFWKGRQK